MSKADVLLKKAAAFEKLALYSDRRSFLHALAVAYETPFTAKYGPDVRAQLNSVVKDFPAVGISEKDTTVYGPVMNALNNFDNLDKDALISALKIARSFYGPNHSGQLANLDSLLAKLGGGPPQQEESMQTIEFPAGDPRDVIKGFRPIDRADQKAVFDFAGMQGKIDGSLGPETRKALEAVKNYFAKTYPNNPRMTDQQAIQAAKFQQKFPR